MGGGKRTISGKQAGEHRLCCALHRDEMQVLCVNANENHHLLLTNPYLNTLAPLNSHMPIRIAALHSLHLRADRDSACHMAGAHIQKCANDVEVMGNSRLVLSNCRVSECGRDGALEQ
jgi:hypothetical protein